MENFTGTFQVTGDQGTILLISVSTLSTNYVAEDLTTVYVAEDGITFYIQE